MNRIKGALVGGGVVLGVGVFVAIGMLATSGQYVPGGGGGGAASSTTLTSMTTGMPGASNGQVADWNGSAWALNGYYGDPSQRFGWVEEFDQFATNCTTMGRFIGTASGTGATCAAVTLAGHPGIAGPSTGTTATGYARATNNTANYVFGQNDGAYCAKELVYVPALSTTVIEYMFRVGWLDSVTNAQSADAAQAVYDRPNTGDFWALQTCSNSVCTLAKCDGTGGSTAMAVSAATWVTLEECVTADGVTASLKVNGTQCNTSTTNIPIGTGRATGAGFLVANNSGSVPASEAVYLDYFRLDVPFGVAR